MWNMVSDNGTQGDVSTVLTDRVKNTTPGHPLLRQKLQKTGGLKRQNLFEEEVRQENRPPVTPWTHIYADASACLA